MVCVSDDAILKANLLASPGLVGPSSPHEVILIHKAPGAADGLNMGLERARREWVVCVHQKTQTDYTRSSALSILGAAPHNRGSGALEAGRLEPASPGTVSTRRIIMRHAPSRSVPPAPAEVEPAHPARHDLWQALPQVRSRSDAPDAQPHRRAATPKTSRRQGGRP